MTEIHFIVEEAPEGGFIARAVGAEIFTEAERIEDLHAQIRDAVHCHFDEPEVIPLPTTLPDAALGVECEHEIGDAL